MNDEENGVTMKDAFIQIGLCVLIGVAIGLTINHFTDMATVTIVLSASGNIKQIENHTGFTITNISIQVVGKTEPSTMPARRYYETGCERCGKPWPTYAPLNEHTTWFEGATNGFQIVTGTNQVQLLGSRGCFPLCETCWLELQTPAARLPYYRHLIELWERDAPGEITNWPAVKAAVEAGR